jgi:hypothetical protein
MAVSVVLALAVFSFPALAFNDASTHARTMAIKQANAEENEQDIAPAETEGQAEYKKGDCIVATASSYSWHGEYAWVAGFTEIADSDGEGYLLLFPSYHSRDVAFAKNIEQDTQLVHESLCEKAYTDAVRGDAH